MTLGPDFTGGVPPTFLHDLPARAAQCWPDALALTLGDASWTHAQLQARIAHWASALAALGLQAGARVAVYLNKQLDTVAVSHAITRAGGVLVPVNPLLKSAQVRHILVDAQVSILVTQAARLTLLAPDLAACPTLACVIVLDARAGQLPSSTGAGCPVVDADTCLGTHGAQGTPVVGPSLESDLAAIFYTSGSTGQPKGVMLSHRNLVAGATSVASYLRLTQKDVLLAVLPLSFDAGFSQLTTASLVGARVVLLNYLLPMDAVEALRDHPITGITAVPPLYGQLLSVPWPEGAGRHVRFWANTGGKMPRPVLHGLQARWPQADPYLMYGLTEAFRSTYLPPDQVSHRPDSMGKAIPNVDVRVVREDGAECAPHEPGQLVHRGPLVALGYWRRPEETAGRFKPWPPVVDGSVAQTACREVAVYSGDRVRKDADGFLYFVGREDDMIKSSGYRISPTEVEDLALACPLVREALAMGVDDESLGSVIRVIAVASDQGAPLSEAERTRQLLQHFRSAAPAYMVPRQVEWVPALPRTPNGKLDRQHWRSHERI
jgi:acyl-CoA ligase (AMP-forming) (exosortase A-associated)